MRRKKLKEYLNDFIEQRIDEVSDKANENKKCRMLGFRIRKRQAEIIAKLGKEYSKLLFDCEAAQVRREIITQEIIYRQGILDGIRLANTCRILSKL